MAAKTVFITGTSSGFGKLIAEDFAAKKWRNRILSMLPSRPQ